jgi:WhiB family redox-sensing transcriptional regulator
MGAPPEPAIADWRHDAACQIEDPELFFPDASDKLGTHFAQRVCAFCPVRDPCLRWALDTGQAFGIWGGTTERDRRAIVRRREKAAAVRAALADVRAERAS